MAEVYQGTRFKTIFLKNSFEWFPQCHDLWLWCKRFDDIGLSDRYNAFGKPASGGNLSVRLPGGFVITSSAKLFSQLKKDDLVFVHHWSLSKNQLEVFGSKKPSSESWMHALLYDARPDVHAIFHGHNSAILSYAEQMGAPVNVECESGTRVLAASAATMAKKSNFFVLKNHGFVSLGQSANQAGFLAEKWLYKCEHKK